MYTKQYGTVSDWHFHEAGPTATNKTPIILELAAVCGFNEITKKNLQDIWTRVILWQGLHCRSEVNYEDLIDHIGIRTDNIACSIHQFLKRLWDEAKGGYADA